MASICTAGAADTESVSLDPGLGDLLDMLGPDALLLSVVVVRLRRRPVLASARTLTIDADLAPRVRSCGGVIGESISDGGGKDDNVLSNAFLAPPSDKSFRGLLTFRPGVDDVESSALPDPRLPFVNSLIPTPSLLAFSTNRCARSATLFSRGSCSSSSALNNTVFSPLFSPDIFPNLTTDPGSPVNILVAFTTALNDGVLPPSPYLQESSSPSRCSVYGDLACAASVCDATSGVVAAGSKIVGTAFPPG